MNPLDKTDGLVNKVLFLESILIKIATRPSFDNNFLSFITAVDNPFVS